MRAKIARYTTDEISQTISVRVAMAYFWGLRRREPWCEVWRNWPKD